MKYLKTAGVYKASNVSFDPRTLDARSYVWWRFVKPIGGKVVFNGYRYSPTTQRHQFKVKRLLEELGISIDVYIETKLGLQSLDWDSDAIHIYKDRITALESAIKRKGSKALTNKKRFSEISTLKSKIKSVLELSKRDRQ